MSVAKVIDLEEARARRLAPRIATTMDVVGRDVVVTFPVAVEQLVLSPAKVRFWVDSLLTLLVTAEANPPAGGQP